MKTKRLFSVLIIVVMFLTSFGVYGASSGMPEGLTDLTKNTTSVITVEQAIVIIMSELGKAPGSKALATVNGQKPSSWAANYISEAFNKKWLPSKLPTLTSKASKGFVAGFFLSCNNYKVYGGNYTPEEQEGIDNAILYAALNSALISTNSKDALNKDATKEDISKLKASYRRKNTGWHTRTAAWKLYSANRLTPAAAVFKLCAEAGVNAGNTPSDVADAYFGLGSIMAHNKYKNYYSAAESFKKAIALSPDSKSGINAAAQLKKLPALELGFDYMPDKPVTYEELLSVYANSLDLKVNSTPADFTIKDLNGAAPSDWAKKFVNFIYYYKYAPSIPKSFKDPVSRYWAASFAARIKYLANYDYDKYYTFSDLSGIPADDRMFLNIAVDRNLFPMPAGNKFDPSGKVLRKDLQQLINCYKNPKEPQKQTFTKTNYQKIVDAYYVDNGLDHFPEQNSIIKKRADQLSMVDFGTVYFYSDDPHKKDFETKNYKDEGTKYIRTRFGLNVVINEGIAAARDNKIKAMAELDARDDRSYLMIKDPQQRQDIVSDLSHIVDLYNMDGVHICFEHIPKEAREAFSSFIKALSKELKAKGKILSCVVGAYGSDKSEQGSAYDLDVIGRECDYVKVVLYDDYPAASYSTRKTDGPISNIEMNERILKYMVQKIPSKKLLLGIGAYGIDFNITNKKDAKLLSLTDIDAVTLKAKEGTVRNSFDEKTKSPYFEYTDSNGDQHRIWYENKKSLGLRMDQVHKYSLGGIFYYWIGSDSQDLFDAISEKLK